jgi:murein DD-endopeptidase MepM/ murein hydrolase activator NlpD
VVVAGNWGKLGQTVILDHFDGGYTIYGHLQRVEVNVSRSVAAGRMIGTIGYSGNAKNLERKSLPPHLHFAYVQSFAGPGSDRATPLAKIRNFGQGLRNDFAEDNPLTRVLDPMQAVGFVRCWEDPAPAMTRGPGAEN